MNFNHPTLIKRIKWRLRDAWEIFRYDIPYFFKNIWRFRKEMWGFRPWDYNFNIKMWRASLFELCEYIDKKGLEIDETRLKKVKWMRRAIYLMDLIIGGDFSEIAEKRLGFEYKFSPIEFEPYFNEAGEKYFIMKENEDKLAEIKLRARELKRQRERGAILSRGANSTTRFGPGSTSGRRGGTSFN